MYNKDDSEMDFFYRVFLGLKSKVISMEFEDIKPSQYQTIKNLVNQSSTHRKTDRNHILVKTSV